MIGLALIVLPLALSLPSKSSAGQRMIDDFQPIMQADNRSQFPATTQLFLSLQKISTDFGNLIGLMEQNVATFERVSPGLDHYKPLVDTMGGNVTNYEKISSLPDFGLFAWFFIAPGILLVLLSGWGLLSGRRATNARDATPA